MLISTVIGVLLTLNLAVFGGATHSPIESNATQFESKIADENITLYKAAQKVEIDLGNGKISDLSDQVDEKYLDNCRRLVFNTLQKLPIEHLTTLKKLVFFYQKGERRGYASEDALFMRCQDMSDEVFVAVLVHEVGHIVDLGLLRSEKTQSLSKFMDGSKPVYQDDPSVKFYSISFVDEKNLLLDSNRNDFVSDYAMTDPFEDFAETYAFYVLQGEKFREVAAENQTLNRKYQFMKEFVFVGNEFDFGVSTAFDYKTVFDVTILPYRYDDFLTL
jgi:hypothetical protein